MSEKSYKNLTLLLQEKNFLVQTSLENFNSQKPVEIKCMNNHSFKKYPSDLRISQVICRECVFEKKRRDYFNKIQTILLKYNYTSQIKIYEIDKINARFSFDVYCKNNHKKRVRYCDIERILNSPCLTCNREQTYEKICAILKEKNSKIITNLEDYNSQKKLEIICEDGHKYFTIGRHILQGYNCPKCRVFKMEELSRFYFEELTNKKFPKARPQFLYYEGRRLELDGYNEELKLSFEYNGIQHYKNIYNKFERRQKLDKFKIEKCQEVGIHLIIIPYTLYDFELGKFIVERISNYKRLLLVKSLEDVNISKVKYIKTNTEKIQEIMIKNNWTWIGGTPINTQAKLFFLCSQGHKIQTTLKWIKSKKCKNCISFYDENNHTKSCSKCKEIKPFNEFNKHIRNKTGLSSHCKLCRSQERRRNQTFIDEIKGVKSCSKCKEIKPFNEFYKSKKIKCGLYGQCKSCYKIKRS